MKENNLKKLGFWLSGIWITSIAIYAWIGQKDFWELELNEFGDFLAGSIAPIAFLWFVLAFFQQSKELKQNTKMLNLQKEELRLTREEMAKQSHQLTLQSNYMELEIKREEIKAMPKLVFIGPKGVNEGPGYFKMEIPFKNIGGSALSLSISSPENNLQELIISEATLEKGGMGQISIKSTSSNIFPLDVSLTFTNIHNNNFYISGLIKNDENSIKQWFKNVKKRTFWEVGNEQGAKGYSKEAAYSKSC